MTPQIKDTKNPIEPSTEFDKFNDIKQVSEEDRSKWMGITNLIYRQASREGYAHGFADGKDTYSSTFKVMTQGSAFFIGGVLGTALGSMVLILLLRLHT